MVSFLLEKAGVIVCATCGDETATVAVLASP
jgi:hypothetical protein